MSPLLAQIKRSIAGIDWLAITRVLVVQIVVLSALAYGVTRYVAWSSDAALDEFSRVMEQTSSGAASKADTDGPKLAAVHRVRQTTDCEK